MPFVSDAQRKHFFANNSSSDSVRTNGESRAVFQRMHDDAVQALETGDFAPGSPYEKRGDAEMSRDYAIEKLKESAMPRMTETEKVDWAAYRGSVR